MNYRFKEDIDIVRAFDDWKIVAASGEELVVSDNFMNEIAQAWCFTHNRAEECLVCAGWEE